MTEQLKNVELETLRVAEERDETVKMTADKMEEMEQQAKEAHATLEEHKASYSNADEALEEAKKQQEVTTRVLSCSLFACLILLPLVNFARASLIYRCGTNKGVVLCLWTHVTLWSSTFCASAR